MVLCDSSITRLAQEGMISPFVKECVRELGGKKFLSYGVGSSGYDVRLDTEFKIFSNLNAKIIDPKKFDDGCLASVEAITDEDGTYIIMPPNTYALGLTIETFAIPRDVCATVLGKSTYARAGIIINTTPIEPGFTGRVVIEIANTTPLPSRVYALEGIAQFIFHQLDKPCDVSYADRAGKYNNQQTLQTPLV